VLCGLQYSPRPRVMYAVPYQKWASGSVFLSFYKSLIFSFWIIGPCHSFKELRDFPTVKSKVSMSPVFSDPDPQFFFSDPDPDPHIFFSRNQTHVNFFSGPRSSQGGVIKNKIYQNFFFKAFELKKRAKKNEFGLGLQFL